MSNKQTKTHSLYLLCYNHKDTTNNKTMQTKHRNNDDDVGMMVLEHGSK